MPPLSSPTLLCILGLILGGATPSHAPADWSPSAESLAFRAAQLHRDNLKPAERLPKYLGRDFSALWTRTNAESVLGFIGPNYQRLEVKVLTATHSPTDPALYLLTGKTRVVGTVRSFSGTLRLEHLREAKPRPRLGWGDDRLPVGTREGVVVGRYSFAEPRQQTRAGVFQGIMATNWYLDARNRLRYNDADLSSSDGFTNNQYVGTWASYATGRALRCNWGDYRAPNAGPLDMGAGEFSPAPEFFPYGWKGYTAESTAKSSKAAWWR